MKPEIQLFDPQMAAFATRIMTGFTLFSLSVAGAMFGVPVASLKPAPATRPARARRSLPRRP